MIMKSVRAVFSVVATAIATPALAHSGQHGFGGFAAGFVHPFGGLDHVLAMVGVGLFAALLGGRAIWAVPGSFVGMMLVGGVLGMSGIPVPAFEIGIVASIIVLGALVTWGRPLAPMAAMALVGFFAVFHGYAHGIEVPVAGAGAAYCIGFALASLSLHGLGVGAGTGMLKQRQAMRLSGMAVALAGFWVAFG